MPQRSRGAWVRDKHPKPKVKVDPVESLLPALRFFSCQPNAPKPSSTRRKKYLQNQPAVLDTQIVAHTNQSHVEYYQPPIDYRGLSQEIIHERTFRPAPEYYEREAPRSLVTKQRPQSSHSLASRAARPYSPIERIERPWRHNESRSVSAWSSAATPLDL